MTNAFEDTVAGLHAPGEKGAHEGLTNPAMIPARRNGDDLREVLIAEYGQTEGEAIIELVQPLLAGQALAMAVTFVARLIAPMKGTVTGEALCSALGVQTTWSSLSEAGRALGVTRQRLNNETNRLRNLLSDALPVRTLRSGPLKHIPPDDSGRWLNAIEVSRRLESSVETVAKLRRRGILNGTPGRTENGSPSSKLWFTEADLQPLMHKRLFGGPHQQKASVHELLAG
jgi:hypothetical protein